MAGLFPSLVCSADDAVRDQLKRVLNDYVLASNLAAPLAVEGPADAAGRAPVPC